MLEYKLTKSDEDTKRKANKRKQKLKSDLAEEIWKENKGREKGKYFRNRLVDFESDREYTNTQPSDTRKKHINKHNCDNDEQIKSTDIGPDDKCETNMSNKGSEWKDVKPNTTDKRPSDKRKKHKKEENGENDTEMKNAGIAPDAKLKANMSNRGSDGKDAKMKTKGTRLCDKKQKHMKTVNSEKMNQ